MPSTFYQILNVLPAASEQEIRAAYRQAMLRLHPDKSAAQGTPADTAQYHELQTAWQVAHLVCTCFLYLKVDLYSHKAKLSYTCATEHIHHQQHIGPQLHGHSNLTGLLEVPGQCPCAFNSSSNAKQQCKAARCII